MTLMSKNDYLWPPPELLQKWGRRARGSMLDVALQAAKWGAQQERKRIAMETFNAETASK